MQRPPYTVHMSKPLQVLSDEQGAIVAGFLAPGVHYLRFIGTISSDLGIRGGTLLRKQLDNGPTMVGFFDMSSAQGIDFAARSAVVRALLANRQRLSSFTTLAPIGLLAKTARSMAMTLGSTAHVMEDAEAFEGRLLKAAPFALARLPQSRWQPIVRSLAPRARSITLA